MENYGRLSHRLSHMANMMTVDCCINLERLDLFNNLRMQTSSTKSGPDFCFDLL